MCIIVSLEVPGFACSTFMLKKGNTLLIGHNLDMPFEIPGMIVINKRNVLKTGVSWYELISAKKPASPTVSWVSTYGSVTFNPLGCEFPDGGINETGLYIQEMTLAGTRFPEDSTRPTLFMMQWMQYQLDNHTSVAQVVDNLSEICLDGWAWHFFVGDRSGDYAAIEFIDGQPRIYRGDSMPIPVLCNTPYPQEMATLKTYEGFGGDQTINIQSKNATRFAHAAAMIHDFKEESDAVDYGFAILEGLNRGGTQWSYIIDVPDATIYFRTSVAGSIKFFHIRQLDFSCDTPPRILDINTRVLADDVTEDFRDYTPDINRRFIQEGIAAVNRSGNFTRLVESMGSTIPQLIYTMAEYPETTVCQK